MTSTLDVIAPTRMDIAPLDVLCIEDTLSDFLLIQRTLKQAGLLGHCERVEGSEALTAALAERRWDLVLSDYAVPGMYFTDTLRRFLHHHPDLPLILVSGTIGEVKAMVMVEVGAWDYVPKDSLRRLVPAIKRAMQRAAARGSRKTPTNGAAFLPAAEQRLP
jgi:two-component system, sensor histidine kinase and response regulator